MRAYTYTLPLLRLFDRTEGSSRVPRLYIGFAITDQPAVRGESPCDSVSPSPAQSSMPQWQPHCALASAALLATASDLTSNTTKGGVQP